MAVLLPLIVFMFWLGVRPGLVLDKIEASVAHTMAPLGAPAAPDHGEHSLHTSLEDIGITLGAEAGKEVE
jgi:hypothetical protein